MARKSTFQNSSKPIVNTLEEQHKYDMPTYRRLGVFADTVRLYDSPAASEASKLAAALNVAAPELNRALDAGYKDAYNSESLQGASQAMTDGLAGDQADGNARKPDSKGFFEGYMKVQGNLAYQQDARQLQEDWLKAPKADENGIPVSFDQWSQQWIQKKAAGIQDKSYLEGYVPGMMKELDKIRDAESKASQVALAAKLETDATDFVLGHAKAGMDMGKWEAIRGDLTAFYSAKDANAVLYAAAKKAAKMGDFETVERITELFSQRHTDGTPGLKVYESEKEALVSEAHRVYQAANKREKDTVKENLKREFDEKFSKGFADVLAGDMNLDDFMEQVDTYFQNHPQIGITAMAELKGVISRAGKREETRENEQNFNELLVRLHEGKAGKDAFLQAERDGLITGKQVSALLREQDAIRARDRSIAQGDKAIKTQERNELKSVLGSSLLKSIPSEDAIGVEGREKLAYKQELSVLTLSFYRELDGVIGKGEAAQLDLLDKYQKRAMGIYDRYTGAADSMWKNYKPTYTDKDSLNAAIKRGDPKATQDAKYYTWKQTQGGKTK